jgi:hypothetical protein
VAGARSSNCESREKKPVALEAGLWSSAIDLQKADAKFMRMVRCPALRVAVALGFFLLSLLAVDAHAHECLHEDAGEPEHECALTLLAQGQLEVIGDAGLPVRVLGFPGAISEVRFAAAFDSGLRLPPSCGPPAA